MLDPDVLAGFTRGAQRVVVAGVCLSRRWVGHFDLYFSPLQRYAAFLHVVECAFRGGVPVRSAIARSPLPVQFVVRIIRVSARTARLIRTLLPVVVESLDFALTTRPVRHTAAAAAA